MSIALTAEVTGAKEIAARLREIEGEARDALGVGLAHAAESLRAEAQRLAPRRTGRLRQSIAAVRDGFAALAVTARAPYARFVEFGTRKSPARPFLLPALLGLRRALVARVGDALARAVRSR